MTFLLRKPCLCHTLPAEWSAEEVSANLHIPSLKFALESKSMRGKNLLNSFKARNQASRLSEEPKLQKNELYGQE